MYVNIIYVYTYIHVTARIELLLAITHSGYTAVIAERIGRQNKEDKMRFAIYRCLLL